MQLKKHIKETLSLAYPVAIGQLGYVLMHIVDSIMVGRLGADALAAVSLGSSLCFVIMVFGIGISIALSPLVAFAIGKQDRNDAELLLHQSVYVNTITGFLLIGVNLLLVEMIPLFGQEPAVEHQAMAYGRALAFSLLPIMLFQSYKQFLEGLQIMRPAMVITIVANGVNAVVNYWLIFGGLGVPAFGVVGAGLATFVSRTFMFLALVGFISRSNLAHEYRFNPFPVKWHIESVKKLLRIGIPSGMQYFFEVGAFTVAAVMVGWFGAVPLAAHQVAISISGLTYMITAGVAAASSVRVGHYLGAGELADTRKAGYAAIVIAALFMVGCGILFVLFHPVIPYLYISDAEVIRVASMLLLIAAVYQIFDGTQAVGLGILRGIGDVKVPTAIAFTAYWIIALPSAYLMGMIIGMGVAGIWFGLSVGLAFSAVMLNLRFHILMTKKIRNNGISAQNK